MSRRYLPIAVALSAVLSGISCWAWLERAEEMSPQRIVRVAVSQSGRWIAAGADSGWIGIIDQAQPDTPQRFRGGAGELRDLRFSRDERWVIVEKDGFARHSVQTLGSLEPLRPGDDPGEAQKEAALPESVERSSNAVGGPGGVAVFGNYAGFIEVRDIQTGRTLRRFAFR